MIHVVWHLKARSESVEIAGGDYELGLGKVVEFPIWEIVCGWAGQPLEGGIPCQGLLKDRREYLYFEVVWTVTVILLLDMNWVTKYCASSIR